MKKAKFNEIGSNFFQEDFIRNKQENELPHHNISYFDSGRNAIRFLLDNIEIKEKKVLLPAYTCDTVIEPFITRNYQIDYYDIDINFLVDEKSFKKKVEDWKPRIIFVHAYFGKDTIKNIRSYLKKLEKIYIIEDITQLLLQDDKDLETADFVLGSIRKWCTIPDGAFIRNNTNITINTEKLKENSKLVEKLLGAYKKKIEYVEKNEKELKQEYLKLYKEGQDILDNNKKEIYDMSKYSKEMLSIYDFEIIKEQRRKNYEYLYSNLKIEGIRNTLGKLEKNETPLYFPLIIKKGDRKEFQKYMAENEIYCPIIWQKDKNLNIEKYSCNEIYNKIVCIPCDQRYTENDMKRVVETIRKF